MEINSDDSELTADQLRKLYYDGWIDFLNNTQGKFVRRFKINAGNFSKYIRGKIDHNIAAERALNKWIREDDILKNSEEKNTRMDSELIVCSKRPDGKIIKHKNYIYNPVISSVLQKGLTEIRDLRWVIFCDTDLMDELLWDVQCIPNDFITDRLSICIIHRSSDRYKISTIKKRNVFIMNTHTQGLEARSHMLTINLGIAHQMLPQKVDFIILSGNRIISPEPRLCIIEGGRKCKQIITSREFRDFIVSIGSNFANIERQFSPIVRTLEYYNCKKGKHIIGKLMQIVDGEKYANKICKFLEFHESVSNVLLDGNEVDISNERNVRVIL